MGKYKKGTQAMLDAAKYDATLLPFDTVFVTSTESTLGSGIKVIRSKDEHCQNYNGIAGFEIIGGNGAIYHHFVADLLPTKKSKPKKWQNGTQAQLDAAKDDARLIPKKTYFYHKGYSMYRGSSVDDDKNKVLMIAFDGHSACFSSLLNAGDLYAN